MKKSDNFGKESLHHKILGLFWLHVSQFHVLGGVLCSSCLRAVLPWWYSHNIQHDALSNLVQCVGEIWLWSTCKVGKCKRIMIMLNANYLYLYYCIWTRFKKKLPQEKGLKHFLHLVSHEGCWHKKCACMHVFRVTHDTINEPCKLKCR